MAMKKRSNEFLGLLCNLYIVAILVALPLYTGQGYWRLGDTKYILFRNVTVLSLGCWLAAVLAGRLLAAVPGMPAAAKRTGMLSAGQGADRGRGTVRKGSLSVTDLAVGAYGGAVLLSAACSSYGELAWRGYEGWFMGAFSQLLFVGIYFFVSRQYEGSLWPLYLGEGALFAATAAGLLHRLGIDPLGLMEGWSSKDWEYSHMLSTLGNINWLCGYYSVALALPAAHFLWEKRRLMSCVLYATLVPSLVLLGVQGSQGGLLILAVCMGAGLLCGILGRRPASVLRRLCLLGAGFSLCMPLMWLLMGMRGEKAAVAADGNVFDFVAWYIWILGAAVCMALFWLPGLRARALSEERGAGEDAIRGGAEADFAQLCGEDREGRGGRAKPCRKHRGRAAAVAVLSAAAVGAAVWCLLRLPLEDGFGSGRGLLWRIGLESFGQADLKEKLLGAGPDCYGEAVFARLGSGTEVWKGEHWEGAVFTNAHNELLSQLCNVGLLGTVSYLAIFLTAVWRYGLKKRAGKGGSVFFGGEDWPGWTGLLVCAMYGAHGLISFQQVLNAPLLFLMLGLCEACSRAERMKEE